ncbi:MAG: hypothetical protein V3V31_09470 [Methylococcales bacterium]
MGTVGIVTIPIEDNHAKANHALICRRHTHCIWTLPVGDKDISKRWGLIKAGFSKQARTLFYGEEWMNSSKTKYRESTIWQRRFWEHQIRDQMDFNRHTDYIYWNPIKHTHMSPV